MESGHNKIPVFLISGFLGSGKTTLLRRIHEMNEGRKLVFLINDFSAKDVDATLIREDKKEVVSVAGGSIFCKCLVTEFVNRLKNIPVDFPETEVLVIEASGVANPSVFGQMLTETGLDRQFALTSIITVVDPKSLPALLQTLPNIKTQITLADRIILNKTDLLKKSELHKVRDMIRDINPKSPIIRTQFCNISENLLRTAANETEVKSDEPAHEPQPQYARFSLQSRKKLHLQKLNELLADQADNIYRVKGFVLDEQGICRYADYSSSGLRIASANEPGTLSLEFIFDREQQEEVHNAIREFRRSAFIN